MIERIKEGGWVHGLKLCAVCVLLLTGTYLHKHKYCACNIYLIVYHHPKYCIYRVKSFKAIRRKHGQSVSQKLRSLLSSVTMQFLEWYP